MSRLKDLRVHDPVLENIAFDYVDPENAGYQLFPIVGHTKRGGTIAKFTKDSFKLIDSRRALRTKSKRISDNIDYMDFVLTEHSLESAIDDAEWEEAINPGKEKLLLESNRTKRLQRDIGRILEKNHADLATNPDNFPTGNKMVLSGSDKFSDYDNSKPIQVIKEARNTLRSKIGVYPNTILFGAAVLEKLEEHPAIIDKVKYSQTGIVTQGLLTELMGIQKIIIGKSIYTEEDSDLIDIWGNSIVLAYVPTTPSLNEPAFGYTIRQKNYPKVAKYREPQSHSEVINAIDVQAPVLLGSVAGYLISEVI